MALDSFHEVIENIRSITDLVDPEPDCQTITAIHDQIDKETTERRKELEQAHANLKALARILDTARTSSTRPPGVPSAEQHADNLKRLQHTKISLSKALNDAESTVANKHSELKRLKDDLRQLEESDPAAEHELDGSALRLQIYQGLGIEPILDEKGNLDRVLVESMSRDIHVVKWNNNIPEEDLVEQVWRLSLL
ncbi:hypothetical protein BGW80DRAFT_1456539 [Lactifluus volemus]|nr:hypothetical protein BGW80DRAFT_1456539 [Lactifluus volemus]